MNPSTSVHRIQAVTAPVPVGDVRDFESFVKGALNKGLRKRGAYLNPDQYEDAYAYLCLKAWEEWLRFDPWYKATRKRSFSTFLERRLIEWRLDEWYRQEYGDRRYGRDVVPVELRPDEKETVAKAIEWAEVVASVNTAYLSRVGAWTHENLAIPILIKNARYADLEDELGIPKDVISRRMKDYKAEVRSKGLLAA